MTTDSELLEASMRGERAAFGRLVQRYQTLVCAVSYSATGDRALSEDVAQDTFLAAWRQLPELRQAGKLRPWLCGIARNLGRRARLRRGRELPERAPLEVAADGASPFDAIAEAETERLVWDALSRVPETYREVLVLYYQEHHSASQVATSLGITEAAVLQRLARGRQYLASSVSDLVERSLERARPRRDLPAVIIGALPARTLPRVEPITPSHGGWTMLKIALVTTAIAAAGATTAYAIHRSTDATRESGPTRDATATGAPASAPSSDEPVSRLPHRWLARWLEQVAVRRSAVVATEPVEDARIDPATIERVKLTSGPARGPVDAPVTIVVFTDFLCSHCASVVGTIDELWDDYPDKLRLVIKQFPVHEESELAAEAALAGEAQGKFWELHDLMMANQDDLSKEALVGYAGQAGLDVDAFRAALDAGSYRAGVEADQKTGQEIDVTGTPEFMINGKRFLGNRPIDQFREMIDDALAER